MSPAGDPASGRSSLLTNNGRFTSLYTLGNVGSGWGPAKGSPEYGSGL